MVWDQEVVTQLKYLDNKWARAIDFGLNELKKDTLLNLWLNAVNILVVQKESLQSTLEERLLDEIPLWIKMLFIEKGLMCMELDRMEV
jgi:hypothetical protein